MDIILKKNGGGSTLIPAYRPLSIFDVWGSLGKEMWDAWRPFPSEDSLVPHTDIYEEKGQLVLKTELPGIDRQDLDITLEGDRLTIKAEKREELKEDSTCLTHERYYGQYFRSLTLPNPVKENKITAALIMVSLN